jgi:hypothetical protein
MRDEVAQTVMDSHDTYFRVVTRGGEWTYEHRGTVADSIRGEARGGVVKAWATQYSWPTTMTFSIERYGHEGAARLAKEFCRRGSYLFRLFHDSANPSTVYDVGVVAPCPDDMDFLDFVLAKDAQDPILVLAHDIRTLAPHLG